MTHAADIASWVLLLTGSLFAIVGGIGLLRLPDVFSRMHAGGVTDTLGAGLILAGLVIQAVVLPGTGPERASVAVKLLMVLLFLLVTSPTSAHALAKAALVHGLKPLTRDEAEEDVPSNR